MRKPAFCICENKDTDQLCCNPEADQCLSFRYMDKSLYFLNPKLPVSSHLLWLHSPICVGPDWKPRRPVSHNETQLNLHDCSSFLGKISVILLNNQDYQFSAIYEYNEQSKHASQEHLRRVHILSYPRNYRVHIQMQNANVLLA